MASPNHDVPSCVLVNHWAGSRGTANATTAMYKTSTGLPITATFCAAPPPALSYISVHCPGIDSTDSLMTPTFISEDADLVLLRVPRDRGSMVDNFYSDYFVYRVNPQRPNLDLLPNPDPETFGDKEIAVVSCGDDKYVVAALQFVFGLKPTFKLHLYRSTVGGKQGTWTSQLLYVEEPLRDNVCPVPDSEMYHRTTKVIVLGGDKGTVGWVDLWRGIILCDVLSERPTLQDLPLPLPAEGNLDRFLNNGPSYFRDIAVNESKDTIKYVEMEITPPTSVYYVPPGCNLDWVSYHRRPESVEPGCWTTTTWTMPIPVTSWEDWSLDCSVSLDDLSLGNRRVYKILHRLVSTDDDEESTDDDGGEEGTDDTDDDEESTDDDGGEEGTDDTDDDEESTDDDGGEEGTDDTDDDDESTNDDEEQEATGGTLPIGSLSMAYPTLTILDDDVVYFLSESMLKGNILSLITVDVGKEILQEVEVLGNNRFFGRDFHASGISRCLEQGRLRDGAGGATTQGTQKSRRPSSEAREKAPCSSPFGRAVVRPAGHNELRKKKALLFGAWVLFVSAFVAFSGLYLACGDGL
ncbi:hypothetical protein EJB05_19581, partial [Eragrostis curvula]